MGHWIEEYGSAGLVNIAVFNELQHTITGWPGGKPDADDTYRPERANPYPKRVVVFSPHPDDDVISMGGTIRRLMQHGHDVHIAYETSGNIAVNDEEVSRFMHFVNGFNQLFAGGSDQVISKSYQTIKQLINEQRGSNDDRQALLTLKGLIRRGEARLACAYNGIGTDPMVPSANAPMPCWLLSTRSGKPRPSGPMTAADGCTGAHGTSGTWPTSTCACP